MSNRNFELDRRTTNYWLLVDYIYRLPNTLYFNMLAPFNDDQDERLAHFNDDKDEREVISLNSFDQYDDLAPLQSFLIGFFLFNARGEAVYQPSTIFCESDFIGAF